MLGIADKFHVGNEQRMQVDVFDRLRNEVIEPGLCTHCGTCVGISSGALTMQRTERGPIPVAEPDVDVNLNSEAYNACPGVGIDYPELNLWYFNRHPENWLLGCYSKVLIGYSMIPEVRRGSSSGGVISQALVHLLDAGMIEGAVILRHGWPHPWLSAPVIAQSVEEILAAGQSVYIPIPVNTILDQMTAFEGRLAYVGTPDQVASLRQLQQYGHPGAQKVDYILGPYVGTSIYLPAIVSFLHSNHVRGLEEIIELRYREGEWPGYLQIKTKSGKVLRAEKFYYNYLIPFYLTSSSLLAVDFTNELTDISVGDAWHPQLETKGKGYSVVLARTSKGLALLENMQMEKSLHLEEITLDDALSMHGHMIDFKKRGAFIRMGWRKAVGLATSEYGYKPRKISLARKVIEGFILGLLLLGRTNLVRKVVQWIPIRVLGPLFNTVRRIWKSVSKPTKRRGLKDLDFIITHKPEKI